MPDPVSLGDPIIAETLPAPTFQTSVDAQSSASTIEARRLGKIPGLDGVHGNRRAHRCRLSFQCHLAHSSVRGRPWRDGTARHVLRPQRVPHHQSPVSRGQSKNGRIGKWAFYERRILRLVPALVVVLAAHCLFAYLTGISFHEEWTSLIGSVAFYYSNWKLAHSTPMHLGGNIADGLQHMWSLSFEEQFYLVWPWITIFLLTIRHQLRIVIAVMLAMMAVVDVHMALMYHGIGSYYADFIRTDTRAGSILMGALLRAHLGAWPRAQAIPSRGRLDCGNISLGLHAVYQQHRSVSVWGGLVQLTSHVQSSFWPSWMASGPADISFFQLKPLVLLGLISYGVYLWHLPILFAIRYYGPHWNDVVKVVVAVTATLALSIASWFLVERPFMRLILPRPFIVQKCGSCNWEFLDPRPTEAELPALLPRRLPRLQREPQSR